MMAEIWFYHLERESTEQVLPLLLRRGLEKGLRLSVETTSLDRVKDWSIKLWSTEDTSFLAHGFEGEPSSCVQPIWLASGPENSNGSTFRFYVDGAQPQTSIAFDRASVLFNGKDERETELARALWKSARSQGLTTRYQRQDETGQWREVVSE